MDENDPVTSPTSRFHPGSDLNPSGLPRPSSVPRGAAGGSRWSKFRALARMSVKIRWRYSWKIVAPHVKNRSNPDQFSSGLCPGGLQRLGMLLSPVRVLCLVLGPNINSDLFHKPADVEGWSCSSIYCPAYGTLNLPRSSDTMHVLCTPGFDIFCQHSLIFVRKSSREDP
jgi:hypothetical protein